MKDPINDSSVGRYLTDLTNEEIGKFYSVRLTKAGARKTIGSRLNVEELLKTLGYEIDIDEMRFDSKISYKVQVLDLIRRNILSYSTCGKLVPALTWTNGRVDNDSSHVVQN